MVAVPLFRKYYLIAASKIGIPLMETVAPDAATAAYNLFCRLANPAAEEPWVIIVPEHLRKILSSIVKGAGGFDGEEIYYLVEASEEVDSFRSLLPPILTSAILRNLENYIRSLKFH